MKMSSLERFVEAQNRMYDTALAEVRAGEKHSHWMWYIFPQVRGLGYSDMAHFYGIEGLKEASDYMAHPILSKRLIEITGELLNLPSDISATSIFGYTDAMKLRSSMTLFSLVSIPGSVFHKVIDRYFDGKKDDMTFEILSRSISE